MTHMDPLTCTDWRKWDTLSPFLSLSCCLFALYFNFFFSLCLFRIIPSWWIHSYRDIFKRFCVLQLLYYGILNTLSCVDWGNNIIELNVILCILSTSEPMDLFENIEVDVANPTHQFGLCRPAATNPALPYLSRNLLKYTNLYIFASTDLYFPGMHSGTFEQNSMIHFQEDILITED